MHIPTYPCVQATWRHGYWVRDMTQQCYAGAHLRVFVPIGVASIVVFCFTPPLASFLLLWSVRSRGRQQVLQQQHDKRRPLRALLQLLRSCCGLAPSADQARPWGLGAEEARVEPADPLQDDDDVRRKYGFLYSRYRWGDALHFVHAVPMGVNRCLPVAL